MLFFYGGLWIHLAWRAIFMRVTTNIHRVALEFNFWCKSWNLGTARGNVGMRAELLFLVIVVPTGCFNNEYHPRVVIIRINWLFSTVTSYNINEIMGIFHSATVRLAECIPIPRATRLHIHRKWASISSIIHFVYWSQVDDVFYLLSLYLYMYGIFSNMIRLWGL